MNTPDRDEDGHDKERAKAVRPASPSPQPQFQPPLTSLLVVGLFVIFAGLSLALAAPVVGIAFGCVVVAGSAAVLVWARERARRSYVAFSIGTAIMGAAMSCAGALRLSPSIDEAPVRLGAKPGENLARVEMREELLSTPSAVLERLDREFAEASGTFSEPSFGTAADALREIQEELHDLIGMAEDATRPNIVDALRSRVARAEQEFGDARVALSEKRLSRAQRLYADEKFEQARAEAFEVHNELEIAKNTANLPASYGGRIEDLWPTAERVLARAVRGKEFPDLVAYFDEWARTKKDLRRKVRAISSRQEHQFVAIEMGLALYYLDHLSNMEPDEARWVPEKYRRDSFATKIRADLQPLFQEGDVKLEYFNACGDKPEQIETEAWSLVRRSAHDPDSISIGECTDPMLTKRRCWKYVCQVRGRNALGALVLNELTFYQNATTISTR